MLSCKFGKISQGFFFIILILSMAGCAFSNSQSEEIALPKNTASSQESLAVEVTNTLPAVTNTLIPSKPPHSPTAIQPAPTSEATLTNEVVNQIITKGALRVATTPPDKEWRSQTPDNVWWSEDGNILFFQDEISHLAWSYNILEGTEESIPYLPRSLSELENELASLIPQNAIPYAISPQNRFLLYAIPLSDPVPLSPSTFEDENLNPQYTAELWVLKGDETYQLGNVDLCFLIQSPRWSVAENHAYVNTLFTPDMQRACIHDVWWIDLNSLTVGSLPIRPDTDKSLIVQDISKDGTHFLIVEAGKRGTQYLIDNSTGEYQGVINDFGGSVLLETEDGLVLVGRVVDYGSSLDDYKTEIWYSDVETKNPEKIVTIKGLVTQWSVSPNQEYIAYVISSRDSYKGTEANIENGIWLVSIP